MRGFEGSCSVDEKRAPRKAVVAEAKVAERLAQGQEAKTARWPDRHAAEVAPLVATEIVPAIGAKPLRMTTRED
jgi:hypothetical protein